MTEKELHRLRRQDLLQLLLSQSKEVAQLSEDMEARDAENEELKAENAHLKEKLDERDDHIARLIERLDEREETIARLERQGIFAVREDGTQEVRLGDIFRVAHEAAEQYLHALTEE